MIGGVDNGSTADIAFGTFQGSAGIRMRDDFAEVAYFGRAPSRFPASGTIDGKPCVASGVRPTDVKGMVVLLVPNVGGKG